MKAVINRPERTFSEIWAEIVELNIELTKAIQRGKR
jgi:hypothetical protein